MSAPAPEGEGNKAAAKSSSEAATAGKLERRHSESASAQSSAPEHAPQSSETQAADPAGHLAEAEQNVLWQQLIQHAVSETRLGDSDQRASTIKGIDTEVMRLSASSSPPTSIAVPLLAALAGLRPGNSAAVLCLPLLLTSLLSDLQALALEGLISVLEALATLQYYPGEDFMQRMVSQTLERQQGGPWDLSEASRWCWATASLGELAAATQGIEIVAAQQSSAWAPWALQDLGRFLWAHAVTGAVTGNLALKLGVRNVPDEEVSSETLHQLAAACLALPEAQHCLPPAIVQKALQARKSQLTEQASSEDLGSVATTLTEMHCGFHKNVLLESDMLRLDLEVLPGIALFLDGPESFCANVPWQPTGSTILRWRLASQQQYKVVSLPLHEWAALESADERHNYLAHLLTAPSVLEANTKAPENPVPALDQETLASFMQQASLQSSNAFPALHQLEGADSGSLGLSGLHIPKKLFSQLSLGGKVTGLLDKASQASPFPDFAGTNVPSQLTNLSEASFATQSSQDSSTRAWSNVAGLRPNLIGMPGTRSAPGPYRIWNDRAEDSRFDEMFRGKKRNSTPEISGLRLQDAPLQDLQSMQDIQHSRPGFGGAADFQGPQNPALGVTLPPRMYADASVELPLAALPPWGAHPEGLPHLQQHPRFPSMADPFHPDGFAPKPASIGDLKRAIEALPLEPGAIEQIAHLLANFNPSQFAILLSELAKDNAFRAWQVFDHVRKLPFTSRLSSLCDEDTFVTMIILCGVWQQPQRALLLVNEMKLRGLRCGAKVFSALHGTLVKTNEGDFAWEVYQHMGNEGMARDKTVFHAMVDVLVKLNRPADALKVLDDMKRARQPAEVQLFNLIVLSCTKMNNPRAALDVYKRMAEDGVQPNTKTFTALIGSVGKMNTVSQAMDIVEELLSHDRDSANMTQTYSALMSACEKAGQWDLAVALFEKMSLQGCKPDVSIFNSMIAACAHGGEFHKARLMFERMHEYDCKPDAVTFANLIRAYKKGGQWCHALHTFEMMQESGCKPHAAVFSSIIDVLWQTGSAWAQAKALRLFNSAVEAGNLAGAAESCKKGTLKVDLQALTVGVAVLSMAAWLKQARQALLRDQAGPLDSSRKLAVVNGLGEHSRAQGHSAAVKEAVGAGLLGCKAPFRLVQDHSRSGRLEASTLALKKWLFSSAFEAYLQLLQGSPEMLHQELSPTPEFLKLEVDEAAKCLELFQRIQKYEQMYPLSLKVLQIHPGAYLSMHKQLVSMTMQYMEAFRVSQEIAHLALALMDRCMLAGINPGDYPDALLICACLRRAAAQERSPIPPAPIIQALTNIPAVSLEHMEQAITSALNNDTECTSAVQCLKIYLRRLGVNLQDDNAVRCASGCAFTLSTTALTEMPALQYPPSLTAAALLVAARKAQGSVPFWPSVLTQLTGYTEANTPAFAAAISTAERLCTRLYTAQEASLLFGTGLV